MTPRRRNVIVGVVVLGGMIALGWMILRFSSSTAGALFSKGTEFRIYADRVDGVSDGTPITYLGVNVGRVSEIQRVAGKREVSIRAVLNEGEQVPQNVRGLIRPQSALGPSATISLELQGEPAGQNIVKGTEINAHHVGGGVIPPEFGALATDIREQQLIRYTAEAVQELRLQLQRAGRTVDSINELVGDPKVRENLRASIASMQKTTENFERFSGRLDSFGNKFDQVADETTATIKQVRTTVDSGGKRFDEISKDLGARLTQTAEILDKLNSVAAKIDKGEGTAGLLVNDGRLYEALVDTARELNLTAEDLRRLVRQWEDEGFHLKL